MLGTAEDRLTKRRERLRISAEKGRILKAFKGVSVGTVSIIEKERKKRGESMDVFLYRLAKAAVKGFA